MVMPPKAVSSVPSAAASPPGRGFLPDFCNIRLVFAVVVGAQLLALVLALVSRPVGADFWGHLSLISLFVQWVALSCAGLLCLCRRGLSRLPPAGEGLAALGLVLLVTAALSETAHMLLPPGFWGGDAVPGDGWRFTWTFTGRNLLVAAIVAAVVLRYSYVQFQWQRQLDARSQARIQALQSRIRPHFMFNSMNTIASLTRSDPALAETVVEDLAELFRASLADAGQLTTLEQELALCRRYLHIESLRLGPRLRVEWAVDGVDGRTQLPALTLQPLLENAIYHGIEPNPTGGEIRIAGRMEGVGSAARVRLEIRNPLPEPSASLPKERRPGHCMALENVRERLLLQLGTRAKLHASARAEGFCTVLYLPCLQSETV